jgi:hypothetical protein
MSDRYAVVTLDGAEFAAPAGTTVHVADPTVTPGSGITVYNLACALARAGRREEALARIREAATLEDRFLELAQTDDDLASIWDDPSFPRP